MSTIRPMRPNDLLRISSTNLDHLTETYHVGFYLEYLTKWPDLCRVIEGIDGEIEGYSMYFLSSPPLFPSQISPPLTHISLHSPRQTRGIPLRPAQPPIRPQNQHKPKLPPLPRPHHRPDHLPHRPTPWLRHPPHLRPRTAVRRPQRMVRGFVCAGREQRCDRLV